MPAGAWADGSARRCCRLVAVHWPLRLPNPWAGLCPRADQLGWVAHCWCGRIGTKLPSTSHRKCKSCSQPSSPRDPPSSAVLHQLLRACDAKSTSHVSIASVTTRPRPRPQPLHLVARVQSAAPSIVGCAPQHPEASGKPWARVPKYQTAAPWVRA